MTRYYRGFTSLCLFSLLFSCGSSKSVLIPPSTPLQVRAYQERVFETNDQNMVMKAVLNVLQDDGFVVKNAVTDLGLLSAEKTIDVQDNWEVFWQTFWLGYNATWSKSSLIECTTNVSNHGKRTKVRLNFQVKMYDNRGNITKVNSVDNAKYYQDFLSKIDKGIFLQAEEL